MSGAFSPWLLLIYIHEQLYMLNVLGLAYRNPSFMNLTWMAVDRRNADIFISAFIIAWVSVPRPSVLYINIDKMYLCAAGVSGYGIIYIYILFIVSSGCLLGLAHLCSSPESSFF